MYTTYHRRPRQAGSYFLPFLSLIILGLIVVLIFQIVDYFRQKNIQSLENKAAVKVVMGRAEIKIWGVENWTAAIDGSILHEGDMIRTAPGSRAILTLLNGSMARLNAQTEVELTDLKSRDTQDDISFALKNGQIWLKRSEKEEVKATFNVATKHLDVTSLGTIFGVDMSGNRESVRVMDGKISVNVRVEDGDGMRVSETVEVAMGQEVSIGQSDISNLQSRKVVPLLAMLSDDFRSGEWYEWNRRQDMTGGVGVAVVDAVKQQQEAPPVQEEAPKQEPAAVTAPVAEPAPTAVLAPLSTPVVLAPKESERTVKSGTVTISGTVSNSTDKVEMTTYIGGKPEPYILQRYKSGSKTWSYVASKEYANFLPGENKFSIVAIGKDGTRSGAAEIVINYDKPKEPADLSAPKVLTFNGGGSAETVEDAVEVAGTIGKGIVKVFVNDFALTRYVPDSGKWSYFARTVYKNLQEGENEYSVYGVDYDGNKTPVTKFTITKKPKPVETPAAAAPATAPETPAAPAPAPAPAPTGSPVL
ncbi:FecR domain-containing protein [Candidatus Peregrinibacteria bacterium]|nr:FecR domain-containing protein [Candidatus Peregrinibacteria bacterium]